MYGRKPKGTVAYMGGIPAVYEPFCWAWGQLIQYNEEFLCNDKEYIHYYRATFSDHAPARNSIVKSSLGDWLFMLDTDHIFEPDILHRLLRSMEELDLDVITGIYQFKKHPFSPVIYKWEDDNEEQDEKEVVKLVEKILPNQKEENKLSRPKKDITNFPQAIAGWDKSVKLMRIGSTGAGCLLVKQKVFDRIKIELNEEPFSRIKSFSEDHSFFYRLKQLDIKVFCDMRVQCKHVILKEIDLEDYDEENVDKAEPKPVDGFA